jgi:toxin ParE1/3/4
MADYIFTNAAVEDLSEIWNYTFDEWSESQADKYYTLLIGFYKKISDNPKMDKNYPQVNKNIFGYRVGQHIIFYRVINSRKIEIMRILHSRMDIRTRL